MRGDVIAGDTCAIEAFREKPNAPTAEEYFQDVRYSWNAGIFLFPKATMIEELEAHAPAIKEQTLAALDAAKNLNGALVLDPVLFDKVDEDSIDYAVMENTSRGAVHGPLECGWNDIGSWSAIAELAETKSVGDVVSFDTEGCYLRSDGGTLVAAVGVKDLVVVAHEGTVLVIPRSRAQDVKAIIKQLKSADRQDRL